MKRYGHLTLILSIICVCSSLEIPEKIRLPVGQPFRHKFVGSHRRINVTDASGEDLPSWLSWDGKSVIEGVPQLGSVGETYLRVTEDHGTDAVTEVRVFEEVNNPCGDDRSTLWMEIAFDAYVDRLSTHHLMLIADAVTKYFEVDSSQLRLYSNEYKEKIRHSEVVESGMQHEVGPRAVTLLWKISCDELDEDATEVLERVLSMGDFITSHKAVLPKLIGWRLTKGSILSRKQRHEGGSGSVLSHFSGFATNEPDDEAPAVTATTTVALRHTRTTVRVDNPPVRLNSLPTFRCKRGAVCELAIPEKTFMDPEDGDTRSLSLSVYPIVAEKNWLLVDRGKQILRGVPLTQGDFEFRLEARDSANQMTSAAFRVSVEEAAPSNHLFELDIQQTYDRLVKDPDTLLSFTEKLANSLGDPLPRNVLIRNIEVGSTGRSIVSWSNASLSNKVCQMKAIEAIKYLMLTKRRERIRSDFLRAMDSRFHVRNVTLKLRDSCLEETREMMSMATTTATSSSTSPSFEAAISSLWLPIALALLFLFLILILVLICCLTRKKSQKTVQSEYVSKGLPVVFPEEIPQEDEVATVATPMLVKEERPPLIISQHENPLYKPPPPLSSTSSPRPRSAATNQRLPPPYVPP